MTRQELKDEMKQVDGDPIVKARMRSLARDRARKRMIAQPCRKATFVITNPTHYAIALRYVKEEGGAPLVVAKGQDLIALKIREIATEHSIPIIEDKLLARSLYKAVEVDKMIPPEFYKAVAEVVFFLFCAATAATRACRIEGNAMQRQGKNYTAEREKALAEGIKEVASELRLIDAADFVAFIRTEQFANIGNLVSSSTELYFKPGTIRFGLSGDVDLQWGGTPSVSLDMEFHHMRVNVYFRLLLEALHAGIEIDYITFDDGSADPDENTQRLMQSDRAARACAGNCGRQPRRLIAFRSARLGHARKPRTRLCA